MDSLSHITFLYKMGFISKSFIVLLLFYVNVTLFMPQNFKYLFVFVNQNL